MGRARFLLCTLHGVCVFRNRTAMGHARFLICTGVSFLTAWAKVVFSPRGLFVTAWLWVKRGCSARGLLFLTRRAIGYLLFLFCTGFIFNSTAMGRGRLLLCIAFINHAAIGRARFLLCMEFINRAVIGRKQLLLCVGFI